MEEYLITWDDTEGDIEEAVRRNLGKPMDDFRRDLVARFHFFPFAVRLTSEELRRKIRGPLKYAIKDAICVRVDEEGIVRIEELSSMSS